jgi:hypothetical protein
METKEDNKTYHYVIEECVETPVKPQWTLFSDDEYPEGDPILLRQDKAEVILSEDGEQTVPEFPKEVYGKIVEKKLVHEGDVIDGATVVKIHKDSVELKKDGKRWPQKKGWPR